MKLTLIVLTAATMFGAQESHLSVSDPSWKGIEVHFVTKVEPPGEFPRAHLIQHRNEAPPVRTNRTVRLHHFIGKRGVIRVAFRDAARAIGTAVGNIRRHGCLHAESSAIAFAGPG